MRVVLSSKFSGVGFLAKLRDKISVVGTRLLKEPERQVHIFFRDTEAAFVASPGVEASHCDGLPHVAGLGMCKKVV